ncbi:hypothetical protein GYMLUDRAFT_34067 [Collybiopsis luxurians FD-317 M1]|nr:hypothetical protein GYMLUDRAFT_34067 [Collybiopsis luxurians FD-317 M1]
MAGVPPPEDRRNIITLYNPSSGHPSSSNPPKNHRDASTSSKKSREEWRHAPTPVLVPVPSKPSSNGVPNPFGGGRTKDTLSGPKPERQSYMNKQKSHTVTSHRPVKRQKTSHDGLLLANEPQIDINSRSAGTNLGSSSQWNRLPADMKAQRDADEDQPVVISSDEDEESNEDLGSASAAPDGKNFTWLKKTKELVSKSKVSSPNHSSRTDEVEDIGQFSEPETLTEKHGFVKAEVTRIEQQTKPPSSGRVDFKKLNIKNGMRTRTPTLKMKVVERSPPPPTHADPVATSHTLFTSSSRSSRTTAKSDFEILPLSEMYFGLKCLGRGYHLVFKSGAPVGFTIRGPDDYKESVTFANDVKSIEVGDPAAEAPCIKFVAKPLPPERRHTGIGGKWGNDFVPGERGKGEVTFKFDKTDSRWSPGAFISFRDICKRNIPEYSHVVGSGQDSLWAAAVQASGTVYNDDVDVVEDDSLNIRAEDVPDLNMLDQPPVSNERSQSDEHHQQPSRRATRASSARKASSSTEEPPSASEGRRSTRQRRDQVPKQPSVDPDEIILSYPPATTGALNITNADLNRLLPNEFLNDTLIEFGLKLWHNELKNENPGLADQIHVFSSFFYKKLNKRNFDEGYESVRRWTSKFDIFEKKFVIVPINENLHWYLAIIYRPELVLLPPPEREVPNTRQHTRSSNVHEKLVLEDVVSDALELITPDDMPPSDLPLSPSGETSTTVQAEAGSTVSERSTPTASGAVSRSGSPTSETAHEPSSEADAEEAARRLTNIEISVESRDVHRLATSATSDDDAMDVDVRVDKTSKSPLSFSAIIASPTNPREEFWRSDVDMNSPRQAESSMKRKGIDDSSDSDDEAKSGASKAASVPPNSFYAPIASRKGKEKARDPPMDMPDGDFVTGDLASLENDGHPTTMIFTLDSLGNRHPRAVSALTRYLQYEAKDKKRCDNPSKAGGRPLPVPTQPNFCDCGVYLIHFARIFVEKAEFLSRIPQGKGATRSSTQRNEDWDGERLGGFREELREKVLALSKNWKAQRPEQSEHNKEDDNSKESRADPVVHELSDSDVDIVETVPAPTQGRKGKSRPSRFRG